MKRILAVCMLLPIVGCATIISGSKDEVAVNSNPAGAEVTITTRGGTPVFSGRTPAAVSLATKREYTVVVKAPGYTEARAEIDKVFNGWVIGNIFCGGLIGGGIDYLTGAFWKLDPDEVIVTLIPASQVPQAPGVHARADGNEVDVYAVLLAKDSEGQIRSLQVPLLRESLATR